MISCAEPPMSARIQRTEGDARTIGFTLVEMLVVLTILGLLAAVTLPRLKLAEGQRLRSVAHALAADMRLLRGEAIRHGKAATLLATGDGYQLSPSGRTVSLPAGITAEFRMSPAVLVTDAREEVTFFADGSSTGGIVTLHRGRSQARITARGLDGWVRLDDGQP
jgi:general secretion pathway protein H